MRKGFTLLELLVACLLLSMLVTILTMIFNQSSIAWRTGTAGIVNLNDARQEIGRFNDLRDDLLPGLKTDEDLNYRTVSLWNNGSLRTDRAFDTATPNFTYADAEKAKKVSISSSGQGQSVSLFTVGVRSAGPDGLWETDDDITTWPEDVQ